MQIFLLEVGKTQLTCGRTLFLSPLTRHEWQKVSFPLSPFIPPSPQSSTPLYTSPLLNTSLILIKMCENFYLQNRNVEMKCKGPLPPVPFTNVGNIKILSGLWVGATFFIFYRYNLYNTVRQITGRGKSYGGKSFYTVSNSNMNTNTACFLFKCVTS